MKRGKRVGKVQTSAGMRRVRADSPTRSRLRQGARPQKLRIKNYELRITNYESGITKGSSAERISIYVVACNR